MTRALLQCLVGLLLVSCNLFWAPVITAAAPDLAGLRELIREFAEAEADLAREREAAAQERLARQQALERQALQRRDAAEARSAELDRTWQENEQRLREVGELLTQHQANLGELFGVTRQVAGDAVGVLQESLLSTRFQPQAGQEERAEFLRRLADAETLPSIDELERLWFELHRELTATGEVIRFRTPVMEADSTRRTTQTVVAVGPFTALAEGEFLGYLPGERVLTRLHGRLPARFGDIAERFEASGPGYARAVVDPAGGALLGLHLERPGLLERISHGAEVGYVIIAVGLIGVAVVLLQLVYLLHTRMSVVRQLRDLDRPSERNPLGRVLRALDDPHAAESPDLARLVVSEAVLHELPRLERFQAFLRLAVGAGPLLGLIGTVIGMILTFKVITASGSSDPRLMAQGIGQAMVATVLGLGIAIPLLFANTLLTSLSSGIARILEEQGHLRLAQHVGMLGGQPLEAAAARCPQYG